MQDESALAVSADPETVVEAVTDEDVEGQDQTPPAEVEETEEVKKTDAAKRRGRVKAHLVRLQAERDAANDRARKAEELAERLKAKAKAPPPIEDEFPDPFEFGSEKAFHRRDQREAEGEAIKAGEVATAAKREAEEIQARERAVIEQSWTAQLAEASTRYADFDAVALSVDVPLSDDMVYLIKTSDSGTDVAYHLGKNHELAAQIAKMNTVEAARAIGWIEASLKQPKPRTATNAPDPINPVRGSAGASRDPSKMSFAEFKAYREAGGTIR